MMMKVARERLEEALARSLRWQQQRGTGDRQARVRALERWQKRRLAVSYADFSADERHRAATAFFTEELYAPADLQARDHDLRRMVPLMTRLLPASAVETVADAVDLQGLTLELDLAMVEHLPGAPETLLGMDWSDYCHAYRQVGRAPDRQRQIDLILAVGRDLDALVSMPLIYRTLKWCRTPARLAGLQELQQFLEHGFEAFRKMSGAEAFLGAIEARERRLCTQILSGTDPDYDVTRLAATDPA